MVVCTRVQNKTTRDIFVDARVIVFDIDVVAGRLVLGHAGQEDALLAINERRVDEVSDAFLNQRYLLVGCSQETRNHNAPF